MSFKRLAKGEAGLGRSWSPTPTWVQRRLLPRPIDGGWPNRAFVRTRSREIGSTPVFLTSCSTRSSSIGSGRESTLENRYSSTDTPETERRRSPSRSQISDPDLLRDVSAHDPRFVYARRPAVPPQMKSNGGVFVIDDFGRQRVRPRDLLNRWMIPLDRGTDYLKLPSGHKLEVPFDCLVFFATNLNPSDLVEEAFLRRIRYKIHMPNPDRKQYAEILRRTCAKRGIEYDESAVDLIYHDFYGKLGISPRSCHPGDLVADLCDHAKYLGEEARLSPELLMHACLSYFIDMPKLTEVEYEDITELVEDGLILNRIPSEALMGETDPPRTQEHRQP